MSASGADRLLQVRVRRAVSSDVEDLAVLLGQLGYPVASDVLARRLRRLAGDESTTLFVAVTSEERVVGLAALHVMQVLERDEPSARLIAFVVREDVRGRGVARRLLGRVEDAARDAGCDGLHVTSAAHRLGAHDVYRGLGFSDSGRRFAKTLRHVESSA